MSGNITRKIRRRIDLVFSKGAHFLLRSKTLARIMPFDQPSVLILSYPRSGSSWLGKVLSMSPSAAYIRETITQPYLFRHGGKFALVDISKDPVARSIYQKLGDETFQGIPSKHPEVVNRLRDFAYPDRKRKRLLIKEVNSRAVDFYCDQYQPRVLLLLRHPAAVASSFYQMG